MQNTDQKFGGENSAGIEEKLYNLDNLSGKFVGLETEVKSPENYKIIVDTNNEVLNIIQDSEKIAVSDSQEQFDKEIYDQKIRHNLDYFNNLALLEIQDLEREQENKRRFEKSRSFRKGLWNAVTSPWQTTKKLTAGAFSAVENLFSSGAREKKRLAAKPEVKINEINYKFDQEVLSLNSNAHLNYLFLRKNGRFATDYEEIENLKKIEADSVNEKRDLELKAWKEGGQERQENNSKIRKIVAGSSYLRFKNWLNKPIPSLSKFNKTEISWNNFKAFVIGDESKYTYPKAKVKKVGVAAVAYNEDNTNSGVVAPIAIKKPKKIEEKSEFGNWMKRSVVAGVFGLLAILGFYHKKNQKTENANTYNQAAMVANNSTADGVKSGEVSEPKKVEVSENDNLENTAESPVAKPEPVAKKAVASHSNVGSQRTHRSVSKPAVAEQKAEPQISEQKTLKSAQELLLEVEEMKLKDSWKTRIANLKAKILNPGYVQPTVPTGFSPYDNGMITSTNIKGIPQEDSYESHIAIVEGIIAKSDLSQEDIENAEKALTSSEDRMKNNILAENQARYVNVFDIHMTSARAKLKGLRQRAVQQLFRGETDNENLYVVSSTNGKKHSVDLNKLSAEIENLPTKANFKNNAWGEWSCAYAKWFTDTQIPTAK